MGLASLATAQITGSVFVVCLYGRCLLGFVMVLCEDLMRFVLVLCEDSRCCGGLICVLLGGRDLGVLYFGDAWR